MYEKITILSKKKHSITDLAYMAGIVDGEGSISLSMVGTKNNRRGPLHTLQMCIVNCNEDLLDWCMDRFTGKLYARKIIPGRKPCFTLRYERLLAEFILQRILPYMIVKKTRAEIALRFCETFTSRQDPITDEKWEIRTQCYEEMQSLNKFGTH